MRGEKWSMQTVDVVGEASAARVGFLGRREWTVLAVTLLFWLFDGYETYTLLLTARPALHELLPASQLQAVPRYTAYLISLTLLGWATGGILGGILGDKLGRRRTMIVSVLIYAVFTGLSALSSTWLMLGVTRVLTGIGIGAEWGVGTSLLQETWPQHARTKGAGLLQAGFSLGALVASGLWIIVGANLGLSWRWMYGVGILPAIVAALLVRVIPESTRWTRAARGAIRPSEVLRGPRRGILLLSILVSISITVGWWAISSWVPSYTAALATTAKSAAYFSGMAGILYNVGEIAGCIVFGFMADALGRRVTTVAYFIGSLIITPIIFLLVHNVTAVVLLQVVNGYLTGGLYSWYAIHPPELFPTAIRATAVSLIFNSARYLAMIGPIVASVLITFFKGYGVAATAFAVVYILGIIAVMMLPETKGRPLPE
jgi:MFS family permease